MKKIIRLTETDLCKIVNLILKEQSENKLSNKIYSVIKNLPLVKKIEKSYNPDLKKHIINLVGITPKLKGKESELISNAATNKLGLEDLANKLNSEISKLENSKLNEQGVTPTGWIISIPTLIFLILFIRQIVYNKLNPESNQKKTTRQTEIPQQVKEKNEVDKKLEIFNGKTVNLYNDPEEQILFGTEKIYDMRFFDKSNEGGRSGIKFGLGLSIQDIDSENELSTKLAKLMGVYEIVCMSNPTRLANFIVKEGQYTKDYKYNKKFTDSVSTIAGQYCKRPEADFGVIGKLKTNNMS